MGTITVTPDPVNGRMLVQWAAVTADEQLTRNWDPVRGGDSVEAYGSLFDYEAPYGVLATYRIDTDSGSGTLTPSDEYARIVHPTRPSLSIAVTVRDDNPQTWTAPGTVHAVIGQRYPLVTYTSRQTHTGTLIFWTPYAQRADVEALFDDGTPLLINPPAAAPLEYEWTWGSLTLEKLDPLGQFGCWWRYDYQRIARPDGAILDDPPNSWAGVIDSHTDWSDLISGHADWTDVLADPHPHA
jgi:hypothetical protein